MLPASPLRRGCGESLEEEQIHQGETAVRRTGPSQGRLLFAVGAASIRVRPRLQAVVEALERNSFTNITMDPDYDLIGDQEAKARSRQRSG